MQLLAYGAVLLLGYILDQRKHELRAEATRERDRMANLKDRKQKAEAQARRRATRIAITRTGEMISVLKAERRAAAQARDALLRRSEERQLAHELVRTLSRRLEKLYERKKRLKAMGSS